MRDIYKKLSIYISEDMTKNFNRKLSLIEKIKNNKFKLLFFLRLTHFLIHKKNKNPIERLLQSISNKFYRYYANKYCLDIKPKTIIGKGFHIPHPIGIVINGKAIIGDNCTIMQQVTIGNNPHRNINKAPIIKNNVFIGAGAKIIGECKIGNNVIIGANSVVTKDIEDNSVVAGVPAKAIKRLKNKK